MMSFFMALSEYCRMLIPVLVCFLLVGLLALLVYLKKTAASYFRDVHNAAVSLNELSRNSDVLCNRREV